MLGVLAATAMADPTRLEVATRDTSAIGGPAVRYAASFQERTGTQVRVTRIAFADLYERIMLGFVTGQMPYDVLLIPSAWLPDFAPYLAPVPERILASPEVEDIYPVYREALMRWRDRPMALTIDGDLHLGAYRRDLFEDVRLRQAFADTHGRALEPPQTWTEYREIAAFFSGRTGPDGTLLGGTLEADARDGQRIWYLFSHAAAYTNHPDYPGAMFFDPGTMAPAIDNPGWVRALTEYVELLRFVPDDVRPLDSEAVRTRFAAGRAAMDIDWADTGVLAGALVGKGRAPIAGKVGFFSLPGSREVWNPKTLIWDRLPQPRSVTFLAFGGWIGVVPAASPHQATAWDYLAWLTKPEHSARDLMDGTSGINPYRRSHLRQSEPWRRLLGARQSEDYLGVLHASLGNSALARDLRLPGYRAYIAALEDQLDRVLAGQVSPAEGLSAAARHWENLTDRLGRNSQREHYRLAMGLDSGPAGR